MIFRYAWNEDDSGPIPSDIEVVHSSMEQQQQQRQQAMFSSGNEQDSSGEELKQQQPVPGHYSHRYPLSDYRPMVNSQSTPQLSGNIQY